MYENQSSCINHNRNDQCDGRDSGGINQNQNHYRVYGQIGSGRMGLSNTFRGDSDMHASGQNYVSPDSRIYGRHIVGSEMNRITYGFHGQNFGGQLGNGSVQQEVSSNGYGTGGMLDRMPQNRGGAHLENSRICSYGGNEDLPVNNAVNAEAHPQTVAGSYYSIAGNYQRGLSESQSGVAMDYPVSTDLALNAGSVEVPRESQSGIKLKDLDQFTRERKLKEAVELLGLLEKENVKIELPRYMALVKACGENEAFSEAKSVHEHLVKSTMNIQSDS